MRPPRNRHTSCTDPAQVVHHAQREQCDARLVFATARHRAAADRFLRLIDEAALPRPDRVEYAAEELTFFWDESRTAVVVELDDRIRRGGPEPEPVG